MDSNTPVAIDPHIAVVSCYGVNTGCDYFHSKALYYIVLQTSASDEIPSIETELVLGHAALICWRLKCELLAAKAIGGQLHIIVNLSSKIALSELLTSLHHFRASWRDDDGRNYWADNYKVLTISPDDESAAINFLHTASRELSIAEEHKFSNYHHIIITTYKGHVVMQTRFRDLFIDAMRDVCQSLDGEMLCTSAMRNHVHLLCTTPVDTPLETFVNRLKAHILKWMHSNEHFRKMPLWGDETIAYAVSPKRLSEEERTVLLQDEIHKYPRPIDESAIIARRLSLRFCLRFV